LVVAAIVGWIGASLIIDAVLRRQRRPDLAEPLRPFQPSAVADEIEDWLRRQ
jgi:hypothetical protein